MDRDQVPGPHEPLGAHAAILTYHSLDQSTSVLSTPPGLFAEHLKILRESNVRLVSLNEIGHALRTGGPLSQRVAITFDDGFENVYEHALASLQRYGVAATVFLVSDYCGRTNSWPGQPLSIERRPLLRWSQVREMSQVGVTFGSHTRTHPDLTGLAPRDIEEELIASKKAIEDAIGRGVDLLAYPYGAHDDTVRSLAARHFTLACTTRLDFVRPRSDVLALERLDMYYFRRPTLVRHLFSPAVRSYIGLRRWARSLRPPGQDRTQGGGYAR
jgi:peptidoglycan/xylan/chitin deacetylase (PgdA/CDA1 family)